MTRYRVRLIKSDGSPRPRPKRAIDEELNSAVEALSGLNPWDPEYEKAVAAVKGLTEARKNLDKPAVSGETTRTLGSLAGILLVLKHEQLFVIASKAFSLIPKI